MQKRVARAHTKYQANGIKTKTKQKKTKAAPAAASPSTPRDRARQLQKCSSMQNDVDDRRCIRMLKTCQQLVTMRYIKSKVNAAISHHTHHIVYMYIISWAHCIALHWQRLQLKLRKESLHLSKCLRNENDSNWNGCVSDIGPFGNMRSKEIESSFYFGRFVSRLKVLCDVCIYVLLLL